MGSEFSGVPAYLVKNDGYYGRDGLYAHPDDDRRFAHFSRAALEMLPELGWTPDVVHCNDWHTGLAPAYLQTCFEGTALDRLPTVFTIHNLQYQGNFPRSSLEYTGLPAGLLREPGFLHYGQLSFIKAGILKANAVSTVSKTYAEEIMTEHLGCGLDHELRARAGDLRGIVNGIDAELWNPAGDRLIPASFGPGDIGGKSECKRHLQEELGLPREPDAPLMAAIMRLVEQKGLDVLLPAIPELAKRAQLVIIGTGQKGYESALEALAKSRPNIAVRLAYDEALSHRVYAGSDMFLAPSQFEPCGLTQMIAMRYGSVPLVRKTGGLADTVTDADESKAGGNGFAFTAYASGALLEAAGRALAAFGDKKRWAEIQRLGMEADFSWKRSAAEYRGLYERLAG